MTATTDLWNQLFELKPKAVLIPMVYGQLLRDFQRAGCTVPFSENFPTENWVSAIAELLAQQSSTTLRQLIYLVDLPESLTRLVLDSENPYSLLAEKILHRELVKIYFKLNYSNGY